MSDVTAPSTDQNPTDFVELELSNLVKHETARSISSTEKNAERIRTSLARLSSTSIEDLEALTAELKRMQDFVVMADLAAFITSEACRIVACVTHPFPEMADI